MVQLNFERSEEKPTERGDFEPMPTDWYPAHVVDSAERQNKNNSGTHISLQWEILGDKYANRKVFEVLNLNNPNAKAVEIAHETLNRICHAVGKSHISDTEDLYYKEILIKVVRVPPVLNENGTERYAAKNEVRGHKASDSGTQQQRKAPPKAAAPSNKKSPPWGNKKAG